MSERRFKIIVANIIGTALEWYDFALFGIFATLLAQHFFPKGDPKAALIGTLGIFAVGYLMRPLGGAIIGHMGDRKSRRIALIISLLIMGLATSLIGLLPTYSSIGIGAPLLLILLRVIQGLAVGGEFPGSLVVLTELAAENRQAFTPSLALVGSGIGILAGSGFASLLADMLSKSQIQQWGWRIPFLFGLVLSLLGLYLRGKIWREQDEDIIAHDSIPFLELLKHNKCDLLKAFCLLSLGAVITGMLSIFLVPYLTHYLHMPLATAYKVLFAVTAIMLLGFPISAYLADHFSVHKKWLLISVALLAICCYPLFVWMQHGERSAIFAVLILAVLYDFSFGPFTPLLIRLFPREVRYSGVAIVHGLAFSIIAGTAPLLLNGLVLKFGTTAPSFYIIVACVAAFTVIYLSDYR